MSTLSDLTEASFWDQRVCLNCCETDEEGGVGDCPECGEGPMVPARRLLTFVNDVLTEEAGEF